MSFYKWNGCNLEIYETQQIKSIFFPKKICGYPICSYSKRYIAVAAESKIYIYDSENESFIQIPYKSKYLRRNMRFDKKDNLYYIDGNNIGVIDLKSGKDAFLYALAKKHHGPQNLGVSPDGRYISFCRYRNDNLSLFVFDKEENELKDYKISVYHYSWLNENNIVLSKGGGLKLLDINTGKSQLLLKDHKSLTKKCSKENAGIFDVFNGIDKLSLWVDLDLLRVINKKIYFSLAIDYFGGGATDKSLKHYGIWSIDYNEKKAKFCYEFPDDYRKASAGYKFLMSKGNIAWYRDGWTIFDGTTQSHLSNEWKQTVCFDSVNA